MIQGVAQLASAHSGRGGRRFRSFHPDQEDACNVRRIFIFQVIDQLLFYGFKIVIVPFGVRMLSK